MSELPAVRRHIPLRQETAHQPPGSLKGIAVHTGETAIKNFQLPLCLLCLPGHGSNSLGQSALDGGNRNMNTEADLKPFYEDLSSNSEEITRNAQQYFSRTARRGFRLAGRGYVAGPYLSPRGKPSAVYVVLDELERHIDALPSADETRAHYEALREAVTTYDPEREFAFRAVSEKTWNVFTVRLIWIT